MLLYDRDRLEYSPDWEFPSEEETDAMIDQMIEEANYYREWETRMTKLMLGLCVLFLNKFEEGNEND